MTESEGATALVGRLVADLTPVRPLRSPGLRWLLWLAIVLIVASGLASISDLGSIRHRLMAAPDMWIACLGSAATAALASLAAFELSLPDRPRWWALIPLPALALWIGASGLGCARSWLVPGTHEASWAETRDCLMFIVGMSVPLSALTIVMLRSGFTLAPTLTAVTAGLAVASAAATLLNFFHPLDASLDDLVVHTGSVLIVVLLNRLVAGRLLTRSGTIRQLSS